MHQKQPPAKIAVSAPSELVSAETLMACPSLFCAVWLAQPEIVMHSRIKRLKVTRNLFMVNLLVSEWLRSRWVVMFELSADGLNFCCCYSGVKLHKPFEQVVSEGWRSPVGVVM